MRRRHEFFFLDGRSWNCNFIDQPKGGSLHGEKKPWPMKDEKKNKLFYFGGEKKGCITSSHGLKARLFGGERKAERGVKENEKRKASSNTGKGDQDSLILLK